MFPGTRFLAGLAGKDVKLLLNGLPSKCTGELGANRETTARRVWIYARDGQERSVGPGFTEVRLSLVQ